MAPTPRESAPPELRAAAEGMEAMFLDYLLQVMRKAGDSETSQELGLESPVTKIYQGMMDTELAERTAKAGGFGLADQIIANVNPPRYTGNEEY